MIVVNPVQIDYKKLAEVAKRSRGKALWYRQFIGRRDYVLTQAAK